MLIRVNANQCTGVIHNAGLMLTTQFKDFFYIILLAVKKKHDHTNALALYILNRLKVDRFDVICINF